MRFKALWHDENKPPAASKRQAARCRVTSDAQTSVTQLCKLIALKRRKDLDTFNGARLISEQKVKALAFSSVDLP